MIKEIKYKGYTATPSDYAAPDGELSSCLGMIVEDGELHPIDQPELVENMTIMLARDEIVEVLLAHKPNGHRNYVLKITGMDHTSLRYWPDSLNVEEAPTLYRLQDGEQLISVEAVGNSLVIITSEGVRYARYNGEICEDIGQLPNLPDISLSLDLMTSGDSSSKGAFTYHYYKEQRKTYLEDRRVELDNLLGHANKLIAKYNKQHFMYPFYVRFAFRLYDNSLVRHSAPILMIPSVINPLFRVLNDPKENDEEIRYELNVYSVYADMLMRLNSEWNYKQWDDIIKSVDIFVSAPIYTYDMAQDSATFEPTMTTLDRLSLYGSCYYGYNNNKYESVCGKWTDMDIYGSLFTPPPLATPLKALLPPLKKRYREDIGKCSSMYLYQSIPVENLRKMRLGVPTRKADIIDDLTNISLMEVMTDNFISQTDITARNTYVYNGRLCLSNVVKRLPQPFALKNALHEGPLESSKANILVYITKNGVEYVVGLDPVDVQTNIRDFMSFYYYPDPDAKKMQIISVQTEEVIFEASMKAHPYLNGAYYYNSLKTASLSPTIVKSVTDDRTYELRNELYVSDVNNPFAFAAVNVVAVGNGDILAMSTAVKALSQGQFGQFPLYVFTTDGIWALSVRNDGSFGSVHPVSRDVCTDSESVTQIDSAILFATEKGVMMLSGSDTTCITDVLDGVTFSAYDYKGLSEIATLAQYDIDGVIDMCSFKNFLDGVRIVYDYTNSHIILYNQSIRYAYVYSLKDKVWGLIQSDIQSHLNSYTDALVVDSHDNLLNYSLSAGKMRGFVVTRPLKFDMPNDYKTIDSIVQRGQFCKGHVKCALYGSRDMKHWNIVSSSLTHEMRGFSGTPYKYFRIAMLCELTGDESIYGASVRLRDKMNNKLR